MRTRQWATLACVALLTLGVGCRDRSSVQDKEDKLCVEAAKLDASVTKLAGLAASNGDPAQIPKIRAEMEARHRDVLEAAKDVTALRIDKLNAAYDNVLKSINGVNSKESLAAAQPTIDHAASDFAAARLDMYDTAGCA